MPHFSNSISNHFYVSNKNRGGGGGGVGKTEKIPTLDEVLDLKQVWVRQNLTLKNGGGGKIGMRQTEDRRCPLYYLPNGPRPKPGSEQTETQPSQTLGQNEKTQAGSEP